MIRIFNHYVSKMAFALLLMEMLILAISAGAATALWFAARGALRGEHVPLMCAMFALAAVFSMSAFGMYQSGACESLRVSVARITPSFALAYVLLNGVLALTPGLDYGREISGLVCVMGALGVALTRAVAFKSATSPWMEARVIFVGSGALARECLELARRTQGSHRFTVVGCVPLLDEDSCVPDALVLREPEPLLALAQRHAVREIVVTVANRRNSAYPIAELLDCALCGLTITDAATFFEREACQIRVDSLPPSYLIFGGGFDQGYLRAASKRAFDLLASAVLSVATLPVMLVTALCIRIEDGGPVLYRQERVGKNGAVFSVLKFRSMRVDAEKSGTPTWASTDDPRVTRTGRVIRLLRIDELPQVINVARGEMSFVGPRPERAYFVEQLVRDVAYYNVRHSIKPGITGLAQVRYQYGASVADAVQKLQYDLYYVKNNSLFLDLLILIDTVQVVLFGKGSR